MIYVRGQDKTNPIILFVHGGPASPAPYPGDQPITRERIIIARKWPQFYGGLSAAHINAQG